MQKLKAFTLMELLIGMIVSSLVISFCYMSYEMIYKQFMKYKAAKQELVDVMQFHSLLNNDFSNAQKIMFQDTQLSVFKNETENINYIFEEALVLRKSGMVVDTFNLKATNILADYITTENNSNKPVTQFSFEVIILEDLEHFQFSKTYAAEMIVNNELRSLQK